MPRQYLSRRTAAARARHQAQGGAGGGRAVALRAAQGGAAGLFGRGGRTRQQAPGPASPPCRLQVSSFPLATMFGMCSLFLLICFLCQRHFASIVHWEQVRASAGHPSPRCRPPLLPYAAERTSYLHAAVLLPAALAPTVCPSRGRRLSFCASVCAQTCRPGVYRLRRSWLRCPSAALLKLSCLLPPSTHPGLPCQAGSHFDEDVHAEAGSSGGKGVEFAKLPTSDEEATGLGPLKTTAGE